MNDAQAVRPYNAHLAECNLADSGFQLLSLDTEFRESRGDNDGSAHPTHDALFEGRRNTGRRSGDHGELSRRGRLEDRWIAKDAMHCLAFWIHRKYDAA